MKSSDKKSGLTARFGSSVCMSLLEVQKGEWNEVRGLEGATRTVAEVRKQESRYSPLIHSWTKFYATLTLALMLTPRPTTAKANERKRVPTL